ncbi:MAG: DUF4398 domain-containing protein [Desulfuromonadaceae bacterium]|nr:DUF4398 domain-containing protein [Desulfuromonas sp.]MDY0185739.1 DUF4398 domain-containing protein [Desulfuromonadaceae bacterium]
MNKKSLMLLNAGVSTFLVVILAGCAAKVPAPEKQVALANQSITQAENAGAAEFAPAELRAAREKLSQAKLAMDKKENLKAQQLADEAMVDANLAEAKVRSVKAQKVVTELKDSIRVLREEMNRNTSR